MKKQMFKICEEVATIAGELISSQIQDYEKYQLIRLDYVFYKNPPVWHVTLKRKDLIPDSPDQAIGAGGEIFIEVNLATGKARIMGYGE